MGDIVRRKWMTMMDVHAGAVERVYGGPVGLVWEMLAGEETERDTGTLAERAGIGKGSRVLVLLPGAGEAARQLARDYGATAIGLAAVPQVVDEAVRRTEAAGLPARVDFQQGNALDMTFHDGVFDAVWGEDAWCYVVDKDRMIREIYRVLKPGGVLAFTDWVQVRAGDEEWHTPETFRVFPHLETVESYANVLERNGFSVTGRGEIPGDPARRVGEMLTALRRGRDNIVGLIGEEAYDDALRGLGFWEKAAGRGLVGRGWLLAGKP
ncbi:methyltransferase domain-containing protein [Methanoculleus sp. Wushi-C6]|uniref:Methyltransferase domain-containing protein n=1 Tax=Methanoculleus caldifontis TaxID=2651577 RepID=A0ABU3X1R1_9EURY|nr:methyltransferase domain-containing protein [Methanoculleus sp. Wushi-C6]MDV2481989.1 methyltransferase domain-containing protein [Methanoculleus sp. Wushi-C6]